MIDNLLIVESPGKIKKLSSILGNKYKIVASVGHITDLEKTKLSIQILQNENGKGFTFIPEYKIMSDKRKVVSNLQNAIKDSRRVIIATDCDREGEGIAEAIQKTFKLSQPDRIIFNQITKDKILYALEHPQKINDNLVRAQKARRVMDRLVGYKISPLLGKQKSAGRVQSVVLKLVADREHEIESAQKDIKKSYKANADFSKDVQNAILKTKLLLKDTIQEQVKWILNKGLDYQITSIKVSDEYKSPSPPFTTSTLQQEAWNKLHIDADITMSTAQQLYEKGLITYHRTDDTKMSEDGQNNIAEFILNQFGAEYHQPKGWEGVSKNQNAQEAHECIRPTNVFYEEKDDFGHESPLQSSLYKIILTRAIASQMASAKYQVQKLVIANQTLIWETLKRNLIFEGYLKLSRDIDDTTTDKFNANVKEGDQVSLLSCQISEQIDKNPSLFNESSLIHKLEVTGIGRPSTYASIIKLVKGRGYVEVKDVNGVDVKLASAKWTSTTDNIKCTETIVRTGKQKKSLGITSVGLEIKNFLELHFPTIIDVSFTAQLEDKLDSIAQGKDDWQQVVSNLFETFYPKVLELQQVKVNNVDNLIGIDTEGCRYSLFNGKYGPAIKKEFPYDQDKYTCFFTPITGEPPKNVEEAKELTKLIKFLGMYYNKPIFCIKGPYGVYLKYGTKKISVKGTDEIHDVHFDAAKKLCR